MSDKQQIRKEFHARRNAIKPEDRKRWNKAICEAILAHKNFQAAQAILGYYPIGSEPDIRPALEQALMLDKALYLPCCKPKTREMVFRQVRSLDALVPGAHGILEPPQGNAPFGHCSIERNCLCLVPGLAFDAHGFRLGYGGGYYDRFLANFQGNTLGVCYEILRQAVPTQAHDLPVDRVISEPKETA